MPHCNSETENVNVSLPAWSKDSLFPFNKVFYISPTVLNFRSKTAICNLYTTILKYMG